MKFITTFTFRPDPVARAEGIARFQKTGGQPPEGIKFLGRVHKICATFSPVVEDADMLEVLQGAVS